MRRQAPPWWLCILAASFFGYWTLLVYCETWRPEPIGLIVDFDAGRMTLADVVPGSPAAVAGLQSGDAIIAVRGQAIHRMLDWLAIGADIEPGRPVSADIDRGGTRVSTTLSLQPVAWSFLATSDQVASRTVRFVQLVALSLATFITFKRSRDPVALIGAWLLATVGVLSVVLPYGIGAIWRRLPLLLGVLLWIPFVSSLAVAPIAFTFFSLFPRAVFRSRRTWVALWTPPAIWLGWHAYFGYHLVYVPDHVTGVPDWSGAIVITSVLYLIAAMVVVVANYHRLEDVNERRRLRVIGVGALVGSASGGFVVSRVWLGSGADLARSFLVSPVAMVGTLLFLALPLSFAYAILRHRLFDVSVIIRQGVQYALARRVLLSVVPILAVLLIVDLFFHRDEPLVEPLRTHVWVYALLGAGVVVAHWRRHQWLESLDRRFFRERYNAHQLLRGVAEQIREAGSFERVAPAVAAHIEAALHPRFAALLIRDPGQSGYRALSSAPSERAPTLLPEHTKLVALLRVLRRPLEVSLAESGWLRQQLPASETEFLRQTGIELFVPIAVDPSRTEAILVLGEKRSEEPYTSDDYDLLVAIADSLALLIERPAVATTDANEMFQECPECGACYDRGTTHCTGEGATLASTRLPRLLAGRYRLERRVGRGGMGVVYAAVDTALDRSVAAKVIREDLTESRDMAERFQREAKIVAGFTHPNVVTVHDFGITAGIRAFLIMELLDGVTLREELQRQTRLPPAKTLEILRGACAAVDAAHGRQLVHRDIKPENIYVVRANSGDVTKVVDFGIAKAFTRDLAFDSSPETRSGVVLGTLPYMAPEQLRGDPVQPAWDIWALAVVAYEMLTGVHPLAGALDGARYDFVPASHTTAVTSHLADAPAAWRAFFLRALALEPERRPVSAHALFAELEAAVQS